MSGSQNPNPQEFTRKSEIESICMFCLSSVRSDRYVPLEEAEDIHADVCPMRQDSTLFYALW